jgi:hypothetical protein
VFSGTTPTIVRVHCAKTHQDEISTISFEIFYNNFRACGVMAEILAWVVVEEYRPESAFPRAMPDMPITGDSIDER